jgi:M6 family metalloprotease-like protein
MKWVVVAAAAASALAFGLTAQAAHERPSGGQGPCAAPELGFGAGEGKNDDAMPPTVGELRIGMLFVDFADSQAATAPQAIHDSYVPPIVDWYRTASYGRLRIAVKPYLHWIRLPRTLEQYEQDHYVGMIEAAVAGADPAFDFSSVDALYVVPSLPTLAATVIDDVPLRVDGTAIHVWAWLATGSLERLPGVSVHETGHVLGLPDLYNDRISSSKHVWDVMTAANPAGMFAWHRWKLGWLDEGEIACLARRRVLETTLTPLERAGGTKALIARTDKAAYVVEVRAPIAEDASLCRGGVLFYRVDFFAGAPANAGLRQRPIRLQPAQPDKSGLQRARCGAEWRAPFGTGRGRVSRTRAWGYELKVLRALPGGAFRVRLARR